jgi:hypothetical protein
LGGLIAFVGSPGTTLAPVAARQTPTVASPPPKTAALSVPAAEIPAPPVDLAASPEPKPAEASPAATRELPPLPTIPSPGQSSPVDTFKASPLPLWQRHAVLFDDDNSVPLIALVIDDVGLQSRQTRRIIQMPGPLTLSFLPYARGVADSAVAARDAGHEVLVHVPMEPGTPDADPGPRALMTGLSVAENQRRLIWNLGRLSGYIGVNNHMGSRFTGDAAAMAPIMRELGKRGLLFLDSKTTSHSVIARLGEKFEMVWLARDVFVDPDGPDNSNVHAQLAVVERTARRRGEAIAIAHPYERTLGLLAEWIDTLAERGFRLAPLSAVVSRRHPDLANPKRSVAAAPSDPARVARP